MLLSFFLMKCAIQPTTPHAPYIVRRSNFTTSGGSSGAPLFEETSDQLVGIHFASGIAVLFSPTVQKILGDLVIAIAEVKNLPSLLEVWVNLPYQLKKSAWKQIQGRINNIYVSLGNASTFMRLYLPIPGGYIQF